MTRVWRRLDVRLFASYALVALVVSGALLVTLSLVAPSRFDEEYRTATGGGGANGTHEESEGEVHSLFVDSLRSSLPVALVSSIGAAGVVSVFVARRILRPVRQVRDATHRIAAGRYDEPVVEPAELELAELARDVNHLGVALQTTERRRARLISEVAHEIRTPLTAIEGYVEGLLDGVFEPTEEVLTSVAEEATRLQRLASDLSELSRAEEGALALHLQRIDLGELAVASADRLRPQFDDKHVDLEIRSGPPLPVDGDADRITQILTNLLGNALTYTEGGGQVVVTTSRDRGSAQVAVTDTGIGLTVDELVLVFDRFYRVAGPARPPGGSGIGLTIARGIARAHGGDVSASSPGPGQGSTFRLDLPLAAAGSLPPLGFTEPSPDEHEDLHPPGVA
jgi:histidine kinase